MKRSAPGNVALVLLALALVAPPARAGSVAVNVIARRVETSHFVVRWDSNAPEWLGQIIFKDWSPSYDIAGDVPTAYRFWGEVVRGLTATGYIQPDFQTSGSFNSIQSDASSAVIAIDSQSAGQPEVTTNYTFHADQPWFKIERTVHFSGQPDSAAYQPYAAQIYEFAPYRALRYRDRSGQIVQRVYCAAGCPTVDWDGHWIEQITVSGSHSLVVASVWQKTHDDTTEFVRGVDTNETLDWASLLRPAKLRTADETTQLILAFSTTPEDTTFLDSLWDLLNPGQGQETGVGPSVARLTLRAAPNPAWGASTVSWSLADPGPADLSIFDLAGRRVATLWRGPAASGPHEARWSGRADTGLPMPAGVYLVRLSSGSGSTTARLALVHGAR